MPDRLPPETVATNAARPSVPYPDTAAPAPPRTNPPARADSSAARPFAESTSNTRGAATVPGFIRITLDQAIERLAGSIRLVEGLEPDHIEVGPGDGVPGAQPGVDVVRLVYRGPSGGRILLDEQRIPRDDRARRRQLNDHFLDNGDTLIGTAPNGVSVATWVDSQGFWLSLVGQMSQDSLRKLMRRVR